jgi:hypothetical protein
VTLSKVNGVYSFAAAGREVVFERIERCMHAWDTVDTMFRISYPRLYQHPQT